MNAFFSNPQVIVGFVTFLAAAAAYLKSLTNHNVLKNIDKNTNGRLTDLMERNRQLLDELTRNNIAIPDHHSKDDDARNS